MIEAEVTINKPLKTVWEYFITPGNWKKWRIYGLKSVTPAWRDGAFLNWELGGSSEILEFVPQSRIVTYGTWMDTTYTFEAAGAGSTKVKIQLSDPRGGAAFTDGGAGEQKRQNENLQRMKELVERET
jgi:uncharacterized protein YndB with AHSA1/START domain